MDMWRFGVSLDQRRDPPPHSGPWGTTSFASHSLFVFLQPTPISEPNYLASARDSSSNSFSIFIFAFSLSLSFLLSFQYYFPSFILIQYVSTRLSIWLLLLYVILSSTFPLYLSQYYFFFSHSRTPLRLCTISFPSSLSSLLVSFLKLYPEYQLSTTAYRYEDHHPTSRVPASLHPLQFPYSLAFSLSNPK